MDMIKYERLKTWAQEADEQKRSGMTQADWCKIHGVSIHTFKYRLKILKKETNQLMEHRPGGSGVRFAEIPAPSPAPGQQKDRTIGQAGITIITDQMRIQISNSASRELVGSVLKAVQDAK